MAVYSYMMGERSQSIWAESHYSIKFTIPFGYGLLSLVLGLTFIHEVRRFFAVEAGIVLFSSKLRTPHDRGFSFLMVSALFPSLPVVFISVRMLWILLEERQFIFSRGSLSSCPLLHGIYIC